MASSRGWMLWCAIAGGLIVTRIGLHFAPDSIRQVACDVHALVYTTLVATAMFWAARVKRTEGSWLAVSWSLLGLSFVMWTAANALWLRASLLGLSSNGLAPDLLFLLFYPLFLAGVACFPRQRRSPRERIRLILDLVIAALAAVVVQWVVIVGPILEQIDDQQGILSRIISLAYPIGDLLAMCAACTLMWTSNVAGSRVPAWLMTAGTGLLVVIDTIYGYQLLTNSYQSGNWLGIGWTISLVAIGLAGVHAATSSVAIPTGSAPQSTAFRPEAGSLLLSSVCFAVAWLVVSAHQVSPGLTLTSWAVLAIIVLTVIRQTLVVIDNRQLTERLMLVNADLDRRVLERTSELAKTQDQLRQSQKMDAIGRLSGSVAHDFNNLLTVILGCAELGLQSSGSSDRVRKQLTSIRDTGQRAAELTRQLLTISRRAPVSVSLTNVHKVMKEIGEMMQRLLQGGITMEVKIGNEPQQIMIDGGQLVQVLMNLAINARDAMPDGGTLTMQSELIDDGSMVRIRVTDTGTGMDEATKQQLFEPFFTTKPVGQGTGLGLATVHGIITQAGGRIEVVSTIGHGSTFIVLLPVATGRADTIPEQPANNGKGFVGLRVLLAEDEPAVRALAVHTLRALGAVVTEAADGAAALDSWHAHRCEFDLVFTDTRMPRVGGPQLIDELRQLRPYFPSILCSGTIEGLEKLVPEDVEILAKPYAIEALLQAVERVCGRLQQRPQQPPSSGLDPGAA